MSHLCHLLEYVDPLHNVVLKSIYSQKFLLPSHNLDPLSVNALLKGKIEKIALDELIKILKLCDAGKYSPNDEIDRATIIKKTQDVLQKINKMLK